MSKKIYFKFDGGLGNLMFQIASIESFAKDNDLIVDYVNTDIHLNNLKNQVRTNTYNPIDYKNIFKNFKWNHEDNNFTKEIKIPYSQTYTYVDLPVEENALYIGYLQTEKYFKHNEQLILDLFNPAYHIISEIDKYNNIFYEKETCSIHVRRGDYIKYNQTYPICSMDYFVKAVSELGYIDTYLIFSDDIKWCKKMFLNDLFFFNKNITFIENEKDYVELFLMTKCNHNIISNSSFSWWGAWLNRHKDKVIIAPKKWWIGECEDIIPNNWIKI